MRAQGGGANAAATLVIGVVRSGLEMTRWYAISLPLAAATASAVGFAAFGAAERDDGADAQVPRHTDRRDGGQCCAGSHAAPVPLVVVFTISRENGAVTHSTVPYDRAAPCAIACAIMDLRAFGVENCSVQGRPTQARRWLEHQS